MKKFFRFLFLIIMFFLAFEVIAVLLTIGISYFEDGSFRIIGCLPWLICRG